MSSISPLGNHLSVVIQAEYRFHHEWMAFATWYSLTKFLPDANLSLVCYRSKTNHDIFTWPKRVGLPIRFISLPVEMHPKAYAAHTAVHGNMATQPMLVLDATAVVARDITDEVLGVLERERFCQSEDGAAWYFRDRPKETLLDTPADRAVTVGRMLSTDVKSDDLPFFTSYRNGVGNFVTADWIDRKEYPFPHADRFAGMVMTANEVHVLKLWKQLNPVFSTVLRG